MRNCILLLTLLALHVRAQIQKQGRWRPSLHDALHKAQHEDAIRHYDLPLQNNTALLETADAVEEAAKIRPPHKVINAEDGTLEITFPDRPPKSHPYKFGHAVPLSLNMTAAGDGEWIENREAGTRTWRFRVKSLGAHSMSIYFSEFHLTPQAELYVLGREETLGAFTAEYNNKAERVFGVVPVSGEVLILEYIEPLPQNGTQSADAPFIPSASTLVVSHIVHGFRSSPFSAGKGKSAGKCHINVACPEGHGKTDMINSVALLINGRGESFCTGAMVNNARRDGRQLFLTAEHCIGRSRVHDFVAGFNYQYRYCNSLLEGKPVTQTVHGMRLLGKSTESDYALLEIVERIPDDWNVFMSGWDAVPALTRTGSIFGIHHPSGDVKKVSLYNGMVDLVRITDAGAGSNFWRVAHWTKGVTEPGSSGSPLFDPQGYIIGHLLGGESSCHHQEAPDYYGALSRDWDLSPIGTFLDPQGSGTRRLSGASLQEIRIRASVDHTTGSDERASSASGVPVTSTVTATVLTLTQFVTTTATTTMTTTLSLPMSVSTQTVTVTDVVTQSIAKTTHIVTTYLKSSRRTVTVTKTIHRPQ